MAYQPQGRRVQLEGYDISRGFKAETVFDPSEQIGQRAQSSARAYAAELNSFTKQQAEINQQSVEALTNFSDTLSKFAIEKQKKYNEEQKNLGIADILNGKTTLNPKLYDTYKKDKQVLETANDAQMQVVSEVKPVDPSFAETLYQESPAVKGWRAYGQAIGKTQAAAAQAESVLEAFLKSDEPIEVVIGGKVKRFTPRQAQTAEEVGAAWNVGMQKFIEASGLNQINPVIIAEHATPVITRLRGEILGQRMREIIQVRESNEREDLRASLIAAADLMGNDPQAAQFNISDLNKRLIELNGMDRTKGNEETHSFMKNLIRIVADKNLRQAETLRKNYQGSLINPDNPTLGTWGDRYDMGDIDEFLNQTGDKMTAELEKAAKGEVEGILKVFYAKPNSSTYNQAVDLLQKLQVKFPKEAAAGLADLTTKGPNWNPAREEDLLNSVRSIGELEALRATGYISDSAYQRGTAKFADQKDLSKLLPSESQTDNRIRGKIREILQNKLGTTEEGFIQNSAFAVAGIRGLALASVLEKARRGEITDATQALQETDRAITALIPEFVSTKTTGNVTSAQYFAAPRSNRVRLSSTATPNKPAVGPTGLDLANVALSRVPAITSSVKDVVIDADRIQLTMDVMKNGGQAPSDVAFLAKTANVSIPELLRRQAAQQNIAFDVNELGQGAATYQQNRVISPRIAEALANPRIVGTQRRQLNAELNRLRNRGNTPSITGPIDVLRFRSAIMGKESGGNYGAVNPDSGALGIGQVMPYNVGPWTMRYYGKRLTPQEYLKDTKAQDAVVNGHLNYLIQQQLLAGYKPEIAVRRAASIWYSGQAGLYNDTKPQYYNGRQYPSIQEYTLDILNRYNSGQ